MEFMQVTDASYVLAESSDHPMHVGLLMLFEPPKGAGSEFVEAPTSRSLPTTTWRRSSARSR